jgi:hypothetical protein
VWCLHLAKAVWIYFVHSLFVKLQQMSEALDLTFVHPRVIVIGSPFVNHSLNALRNYFQKNFVQRDRVNYCIYNFSAEEDYNIEQDLENVITYGFPENNPCPLELLIHVCTLIDTFLNQDLENVIVLHSKNGNVKDLRNGLFLFIFIVSLFDFIGKGRACLVAACVLLLSSQVATSTEAISLIRTKRGKDALTLPSQIRYLFYYEKLLKTESVYPNSFQVLMTKFNSIPKFNSSILNAGCTPFFTIHVLATDVMAQQHASGRRGSQQNSQNSLHHLNPTVYNSFPQFHAKLVYESFNPLQASGTETNNNSTNININNVNSPGRQLLHYRSGYDEFVEYDLSNQLLMIRGDFYFTFYHYSLANHKYETMFQVFLHSAFLEKPVIRTMAETREATTTTATTAPNNNHNLFYVQFPKAFIDFAHTDAEHYLFQENFSVELLFQQKESHPEINSLNDEEFLSMNNSNNLGNPGFPSDAHHHQNNNTHSHHQERVFHHNNHSDYDGPILQRKSVADQRRPGNSNTFFSN